MPYAYATGETRVWTAHDERELKAEHKRATRATRKHLKDLQVEASAQAEQEQSPGAEDRKFMDKLLRRRNTSNLHDREASRGVNPADILPEKRPVTPKAKQSQEGGSHWWSRGHRQTSSQSSQAKVEREPYTPLGVANRTLPAPPVPPRFDLIQSPPDRVRRKSEHDAAARRRARERALYHLETDHDIRRFVVLDKPNDPPIQLKPGTWIPGQINAVDFSREVVAADKRVDVDEFGSLTTPHLVDRFPAPPRSLPPRKSAPRSPLPAPPGPAYTHLPPTRPLNIVPRHKHRDVRDIPIPPIPAELEKSNRDSFLELRRKRSCRV
ncbi:hypothetical protein RSOL_371380 [Rhizoctonia solani AG-3 Rhs1AP]|uniref:Uncharacterized protein n=2 Tax=Rhizoctonia solani AG-3 TaxID=1086053 RepID=A0A074RT73_9AGAM|nr:hypothetical protein RSOL_371380 [Rhizoctonia solani AG-3 Rhs1AP]KEP47863.1 hypothetical protein V565_141450 [Rhizoctonia solani 123E]